MSIVTAVVEGIAACGFSYWAIKPFFYSRVREFNRQVGRMPRRTLAELPEGVRGRIVGRAEPLDEALAAPLSGRRCVYYTARVGVVEGRGLRELAREDRAVIFVLDDGTGRAIVDPSRSQVTLDVDAKGASSTLDRPNAREQAFLDRYKIVSSRFGGLINRPLVYDEAVIEVGETIAIVGEYVREPDPKAMPEAAYRGDTPTRLRMTSSRKQPMIISDKPAATK